MDDCEFFKFVFFFVLEGLILLDMLFFIKLDIYGYVVVFKYFLGNWWFYDIDVNIRIFYFLKYGIYIICSGYVFYIFLKWCLKCYYGDCEI